jgi:hypothetical protein
MSHRCYRTSRSDSRKQIGQTVKIDALSYS